ncbi:P-loop containing nucleoside triphosphate hydrolase protein [Dipodascopsis uninucleata]
MRIRRPTSKRQSTRMREGIKKKAAAQRKKQKKLAKKDPTWKSKKNGRLDIDQIPNSFPYKNKIIEELEKEKLEMKEEREKRRHEARAKTAQEADEPVPTSGAEEDDDEMEVEGGEMNAFLEYARRTAKKYESEEDDRSENEDSMDTDAVEDENSDSVESSGGFGQKATETSRKSFDKIFKTVVEAADVILYVLDARDPEGTRSREIEKTVLSSMDKRLIFVLNKIDLIPSHVQKAWELHLKNFFPTISVKGSNASSNVQQLNHKSITTQNSASVLLRALKAYSTKANLKRSIVVGVIGYPNVGKSSIINALANKIGGRNSTCPTGAEAGVTNSLREIKIDHKLKLLDSPGIVFPSSEDSADRNDKVQQEARLILLGVLPARQITDVIPAITLLLKRLEATPELLDGLLKYYDLPPLMPKFDAVTGRLDKTSDFLVQVARKRGRLGKGGVPNVQAAAMAVVNDWRDGRIQRWTLPKQDDEVVESSSAGRHLVIKGKEGRITEQKEIVQKWAEEFSLEGLWSPDDE